LPRILSSSRSYETISSNLENSMESRRILKSYKTLDKSKEL
jgi:hypothetical protein